MKKRVFLYLAVIATTFSLQSCVSNYVVSSPVIYKTDAKLALIPAKSLNAAKVSLISETKIDATLAKIEKADKELENSRINEYNNTINSILAEADTYIGTPYRFGGMTRNGIDCSAFVLSVFSATMGMTLPRVAASQAQEGESVTKTELKKGDLVFFAHSRRISHVGIVHEVNQETGEIKFIHAATSKGVMVSSLDDNYWGPKYRFAKRVVSEDHTTDISNYAQVTN